MIPLLCPCCKNALSSGDKRLFCENGHSFDLARQGYVNLLLNSSAHQHGDDREMVRARRDFLAAGYYAPLLGALAEKALQLLPRGGAVLDAGCGEGYYTAGIARAFENGKIPCEFAGVDISKNALALAARLLPQAAFAVASVYQMPFPAESFDLIFSLFAPYSEAEFLRLLRPGGVLVRVVPEEKHLFSLKKAVYETPYENERAASIGAGFEKPEEIRLTDRISLRNSADIRNLFAMTPYAHKTSPRDRAKLEALETLETEIDFGILIYRKKA